MQGAKPDVEALMDGVLAAPLQRSYVFVTTLLKRRSWQKEWILLEGAPIQHSDHRY